MELIILIFVISLTYFALAHVLGNRVKYIKRYSMNREMMLFRYDVLRAILLLAHDFVLVIIVLIAFVS